MYRKTDYPKPPAARRPFIELSPVSRTRWMVVVAVAGGLLYLGRIGGRVVHPTLWAQDGAIFLKQARETGLPALWHPYMGYVHLLPRGLAAAFSPLPLTWQPGLYAASAALIGYGVALLALSPRLAWLLPATWQRAALFVLLLVAPARSEVSANIANFISSAPSPCYSSDSPTTRFDPAAGGWRSPPQLFWASAARLACSYCPYFSRGGCGYARATP